MSPDRRPSQSMPGRLLVAVAVVFSLLAVGLGKRSSDAARRDAVTLAEVQSRNLAQAIDRNLTGIVQRIDLVILSVLGELERDAGGGRPDRQRLAAFIAREQALVPEGVAVRVTNPEGRVIFGNPGSDPASTLAGIESFTFLRQHRGTGLFIEKPALGVFTRKWVVRCARRYELADGRFAGIVVIPVLIEQFRQVIGEFDIGPHGTITIRDGDGGLITRHPRPPDQLNSRIGYLSPAPELAAILRSGQREATYFTRTPFDGVPRTYAARLLQTGALRVGVGLAEQDYLALWRRGRTITRVMVAAALLGIWLLVGLLWIAWRRQLEAAQALQASEVRYRTLFNAMSDAFASVDLQGRIVDFNQAFSDLIGRPREEIPALSYEDITPARWHAAEREIIDTQVLPLGRSDPYEKEYLRPDGGIVPVELRTFLIRDGAGQPRTMNAIIRDISERKQVEAQRRLAQETARKLEEQVLQAQKMESLGSLAGGVAHDMNNVLGAILGLASAHIGSHPPGSPLHQAFGTICTAAERGGKMVKSLLSFARRSTAENHEVDLNAILREEVSLLERTTLAKVHLRLELEAGLHPVRGDAGALSSVFMNLCVNAVDAMPDQGTLTLRTRTLDQDWIEVMVEDTGVGMSREVLDKALDPFFTTKGVGKGTGLGLSMAYSTVKAHRGELAILSEPGRGTQVTIRLPACAEAAPLPGPLGAEAALACRGTLRVLLVDDDDLVQSGLRAILESLGLPAADSARSGEEALAMLEAGLEPELVILDLNMPGLGGAGTLPRLRALRPQVPVLLATGQADETALALVAAHPGVTLLTKPFGRQELQLLTQPLRHEG